MNTRLGMAAAVIGTVLLSALAACGGSGVSDTGTGPGPTPPVDTTKPPTVQRASITVQVTIDPADAALAQQAGVGMSGLTVRLTSSRPGEVVRTATTAADGRVRFDSLLEGSYEAGVERPLAVNELAQLPPSDRDAAVFAGGARAVLAPPNAATVTVPLLAARRGGLVMSELFNYAPGPPFYGFGSYLEVFNNADTTVYLDGVVLFLTPGVLHTDIWGTCESLAPFRADSTRLWASQLWAFPGAGRDHPVPPGEARVVALDAIDHRAASPETNQVDLSGAHFEQIGSDADIDNPNAANLRRLSSGTGALGRGYPIGSQVSWGLAQPSAAANLIERTLQRTNGTGSGQVFGVPADAVLDVMSIDHSPATQARLDAVGAVVRACTPWLAERFERAVAAVSEQVERLAIARKSLGRRADGSVWLQRTRASARDVERVPPLRRSLEK